MNTQLKTILTTTAVLSALAGGTVFYAHAETASSPQPGSMMQGGHGEMADMMKMMAQMGQMMEQCNKMMSAMMQQRAHDAPKDPKQQHKE
jgi:hypothetical protein